MHIHPVAIALSAVASIGAGIAYTTGWVGALQMSPGDAAAAEELARNMLAAWALHGASLMALGVGLIIRPRPAAPARRPVPAR